MFNGIFILTVPEGWGTVLTRHSHGDSMTVQTPLNTLWWILAVPTVIMHCGGPFTSCSLSTIPLPSLQSPYTVCGNVDIILPGHHCSSQDTIVPARTPLCQPGHHCSSQDTIVPVGTPLFQSGHHCSSQDTVVPARTPLFQPGHHCSSQDTIVPEPWVL